MTTTTYLPAECIHGLEPVWCSICKRDAGYRPGTTRQQGDCAVLSFTELTGADYAEALERLAAAGRSKGSGTALSTILAALTDAGFSATETRTITRSGTYLVAAYKNGRGHAFTVVNGKINRGGEYVNARQQRAFLVK